MTELYQELDAKIDEATDRVTDGDGASLCRLRGVCCNFGEAGHALYATAIEVAYVGETRTDVERLDGDRVLCPFWRQGRCDARHERPIGCRTYFCDKRWRDRGEELHEHFHRRVAEIMAEYGVPYRYGEFVAALREQFGRS
ncbi:MAG: hypothetical protein AAF488_19340 [Planctomycetota bacterium]